MAAVITGWPTDRNAGDRPVRKVEVKRLRTTLQVMDTCELPIARFLIRWMVRLSSPAGLGGLAVGLVLSGHGRDREVV